MIRIFKCLAIFIVVAFCSDVAAAESLQKEKQPAQIVSEWRPGILSSSPGNSVFYRLPEHIVNLVKVKDKAGYMKVHVTLQAETEANAQSIESNLPIINNSVITYLRNTSPEDLKSSEGLEHIRADLLDRINTIIAPNKIQAVLFEEILTQ